MKKFVFIISLVLGISACSTTGHPPPAGRNMLTFKQIASEIWVQHEALQAKTDLSRTTALNDLNTQ